MTSATGTGRPIDHAAPRRPRIWFEVEDLLRYYDYYPHPTGIQRVSLEIFRAIERLYGHEARVKFCRLSLYTGRFQTLTFAAVLAWCLNPPGVDAPWRVVPLPGTPRGECRRAVRGLARTPRYLRRLLGPIAHDMMRLRTAQPAFERDLVAGDIIVCLGGPWINPWYSDLVAALKAAHGVKFVQLVHDVIPLVSPQWAAAFVGRPFSRWLTRMASVTDLILTQSSGTRRDLLTVAASRDLALPPVEVITFGTEVESTRVQRARVRDHLVDRLRRRYVLFVSTIEIRKNHAFLLRVWKRLVGRHGATAVPDLVLVGRLGHPLVDMRRFRSDLAASDYVDGKVVLLLDLPDADLPEVYRRCLFTIYPSLYEGWGLPVAESLAHGKFCVASNRGAIPEAGGDFIDYFDPTDEEDALATIERVLFEPGYLSARETRLRTDYRPPTWMECAQGLVRTLEQLADRTGAGPRRALEPESLTPTPPGSAP